MEQLEEGAPDKHEEEESIVIISIDMYEKQRNKNVWMIFLRLSWFLRISKPIHNIVRTHCNRVSVQICFQ